MNELIHRCMIFTDRNGKIISRDSNPMCPRLSMEYEKDGTKIRFSVVHSMGGVGSFRMDVHYNGKLVLDAEESLKGGCYIYPADPKINEYIAGGWEKRIPVIK